MVNQTDNSFLIFLLDVNGNCVAVADFEAKGTTAKVVELTDDDTVPGSEEPEIHSGIAFDFIGLLQNLKLTVAEMVSRVSNYLQNIFPTGEKEKSSGDADGNTKANVMDNMNVMGGSFMGLAMLVIMVVLVKRA